MCKRDLCLDFLTYLNDATLAGDGERNPSTLELLLLDLGGAYGERNPSRSLFSPTYTLEFLLPDLGGAFGAMA